MKSHDNALFLSLLYVSSLRMGRTRRPADKVINTPIEAQEPRTLARSSAVPVLAVPDWTTKVRSQLRGFDTYHLLSSSRRIMKHCVYQMRRLRSWSVRHVSPPSQKRGLVFTLRVGVRVDAVLVPVTWHVSITRPCVEGALNLIEVKVGCIYAWHLSGCQRSAVLLKALMSWHPNTIMM